MLMISQDEASLAAYLLQEETSLAWQAVMSRLVYTIACKKTVKYLSTL